MSDSNSVGESNIVGVAVSSPSTGGGGSHGRRRRRRRRGGKRPQHPPIGLLREPKLMDEMRNDANLQATDPHRLAKYYVKLYGEDALERLTLHFYRGDFWRYENGRYQIVTSKEMRGLVNAGVSAVVTQFDLRDDKGYLLRVGGGLVSDVTEALQGLTQIPEYLEQPLGLGALKGETGWISMKNGLLNLDDFIKTGTPKTRDPNPSWFSPVCLPYAFDMYAKCPRWLEFLHEMFQGDQEVIKLVQEWFGYCLTTDTSLHKFLVLIGEGANGKSVLLNVLEGLVGKESTSNVGVEVFGERFGLQPTVGKLVNICAEIEASDLHEGNFKKFVAGDPISVDRKFKDVISVRPTAKMIFATNNMPRFKDRSDGMARRAILVPCLVVIPKDRQDPKLAEKLKDELPGIFNWAVEGVRRLRQRERFIEPGACKELLEEHIRASNPIRVFLEECCVVDTAGSVPIDDLDNGYQAWCGAEGIRCEDREELGKEMKRRFPNAKRKRMTKSEDPHRPYKYVGISWKKDDPAEES